MILKTLIIVMSFSVALSETTVPGIDRTLSEGVESRGYKIVYGDEDLTVINQAITDMEKSEALKSKINLVEAIKPLAAEDVKCFMSVDRYCSSEMRHIKGVLVQALKDDCAKCSDDEKNSAGKVAASMMAHDPVAWKLFLTRCVLLRKSEKIESNPNLPDLKPIGEPEIIRTKQRYIMPGIKVRVKRYNAKKQTLV